MILINIFLNEQKSNNSRFWKELLFTFLLPTLEQKTNMDLCLGLSTKPLRQENKCEADTAKFGVITKAN